MAFCFKSDSNLMKHPGQYETEVTVCFDVDMCWILYRFVKQLDTNFGAQMEAVLDLWDVDCHLEDILTSKIS